ncbi:hypothetical protein FRB93_013536 [Tulasnella sp. JGI-2019a]|nr:hypothetical protein FRB93_013536 [Tulasnella sp. JGI-2019a]
MDDYMIQALNTFSEGASRMARSQLSSDDPQLTEVQSSMIMMRSFNDAFKTFTDGLHRLRSSKARHHNTLLPISRLPNELLVKIFAFAYVLKTDVPMGPYDFRRPRYHLRDPLVGRMLEALVLVCQEWKDIAYDAPSLWAYIHTNPPSANIKYLARSGQAPLHISLHSLDLHHEELKTKIFQEVHRWKSVKISGVTREHLEELEQSPAPLLEKFYVRCANDAGMGRTLNFFCGSAGRLRHLTLLDTRIPWESNLLSRLRALEISNDEDGPSAQQVVNALRSCPDLTSFRLHLTPDLHPGPMPLDTSIINLPQLEHLSIRVHPLMTEELLRRVRIPRCKSFNVDQARATGPTFSAAMEGLIPSMLSILLAVSKLSIHVGSTFLQYIATVEIDEESERERDREQRIHIQASGEQSTSAFAFETLSWLLDNVHTPSFSIPVSLHISQITSSQATTPIIDRLSSSITKLELALDDASLAKTIISYLAEPFEVDVDGTTRLRWPLPHLADLSFMWCRDLEPVAILACVQHRAGRGSSSEGRREYREELPARLTRLRLPHRSSTEAVMGMFPDCMEWCGLDLEESLERDIFGGSDSDLSEG